MKASCDSFSMAPNNAVFTRIVPSGRAAALMLESSITKKRNSSALVVPAGGWEVPWTGRVCRCVWRFSAGRVIGVHDSGRRRRPGALCLGVHQEPFPVHFQFRGRAILDSFGVLRFLLEVGGVVDLLLKQSSVHRDPLCSELMMTRPAPLGLD